MITRNALQDSHERFLSSFLLLALTLCLPLGGGLRAQTRSYTIQIASATSEAEARTIVSNLRTKGVEAYWVKAEVPGKGTRYRVRLGKFKAQADAKAQADRVLGQGWIKEFIVTLYEPPTEGKPAAEPAPRSSQLALKPEMKPEATPETPAKPAPEKPAPKPEALPVAKKDLAKAEPIAEENPAPPRKAEPKPEPRLDPADRATAEPPRTIDARIAPSAGSESLPAIATPAVAEALADVSIANDNWKIVRRSVETDKNLRAIHFVDSMTGWAAGDAGAVYRTTDGGRTWKPLLSGAPANINFIYFVDWNHGWMVGEKSSRDENAETLLFSTVNGGRTWSHKPMPDLLSLHFLDAKNGWAVGRNATLLKTSDGGNEWVKVDSMDKLIGLPVESTSYTYGFRDIFFTDAQHGWLIGNFYGRARSNIGGIFTTEDGGATWKRLPVTIQTQHASGRFTPGVFHSVRFTDANVGSVTGEMYDGEGRFFFVLHTRDGGKTWEQFRTPSRATHNTQFLDPSYGWSAAFAPREGAADAIVYDTTLMRTDNGGMSWRNDFTARGRRIYGVFFLSPSRGWAVGDRGMILRYEEKGKAN